MDKIENILVERGHRYGPYAANARVAQHLKRALRLSMVGGQGIPDTQLEALDLIITKVSRIVTGDFTYADNWDDIAGYATLISNELKESNGTAVAKTGP